MADETDDEGGGEGEYGGFVFEDGQATEAGGTGIDPDAVDSRRVATAVLLLVALVVLAYLAQPLVAGALAGVFGQDSPDDSGEGALASGQASSTSVTPTAGTPNDTDGRTATARPTTTAGAVQEPTRTQNTAQTTPTTTATATTQTAAESGGSGEETATRSGRSPAIDGFAVTDRSGDGAATFDVAWNVSDPDRDLTGVNVTLVADPDGEARTVEQHRFDAGGARTTGSTTFAVPDGGGETYEVSIEVTDGAGNTVFELSREVADGRPDG